MGSAALFEAAKSIRDWSLNEGRASTLNGKSNGKAVDAYASLVFNDKMQQDRLPKPAYRALRATIVAAATAACAATRERSRGAARAAPRHPRARGRAPRSRR